MAEDELVARLREMATEQSDAVMGCDAPDLLREAADALSRETADESKRKFERSQQRWGNLKARIKGEIDSLSNPCLSVQQRHQYQNGVARLNWVLDEMAKSPDVLAEALGRVPTGTTEAT